MREPLMRQEIFGPVLPLVTVSGAEEAVQHITDVCDHPLAVYVFAEDQVRARASPAYEVLFCIHRQTAQRSFRLVRKVPDIGGVGLALATAKEIPTLGIQFLAVGKY